MRRLTTVPLPVRLRRAGNRSQFNRRQSPLRVRAGPALSVMAGSLVTTLPIILDDPLLPPIGLLMLISWRLLRSDCFPLWAGAPLGLWDDLFSGQPLGSAIISWSLILLAYEFLEMRIVWVNYWTSWLVGIIAISFALLFGLATVGMFQPRPEAIVIIPQIIIAALCLPIIQRITARVDRWRLST